MEQKKRFALALLVMLGLLAAACGPRAAEPEVPPKPAAIVETQMVMAAPTAPPAQPGLASEGYRRDLSSDLDQQVQAGERMIISTAQLTLVVEDVEVTLPQVHNLVRRFEGYIVQSSSYRTYADRLAATVVLRVPAERFDEALDALRALAGKVQSESLSGEDVTDQYVDLQSRLKALQATETELLALLTEVRQSTGNAQQKAQAILDIYNRLTEVRSQIEQIQGRMNYLEQMSAMATITVELLPREPEVEQPVVEEGFSVLGILRGAARTLVQVLQALLQALIWFVVVLLPPALLILGLPAVLLFWWLRRRRRKKIESEA